MKSPIECGHQIMIGFKHSFSSIISRGFDCKSLYLIVLYLMQWHGRGITILSLVAAFHSRTNVHPRTSGAERYVCPCMCTCACMCVCVSVCAVCL